MDLRYQWFKRNRPVGETITIQLKGGDIYLMSDIAVGWNWRKSSELTLRHSAGAPRFTALPKPKSKAKKARKEPDHDAEEEERPAKKAKMVEPEAGGGGGGGGAGGDADE
jgi:hypothetical protein